MRLPRISYPNLLLFVVDISIASVLLTTDIDCFANIVGRLLPAKFVQYTCVLFVNNLTRYHI